MITPPVFKCFKAAFVKKKKEKMFCAEGPFQLLFADLSHALLRLLLGGVVDQNVQLAEFFHCPVDRIFAELLAADVSSDEQAVSAMFLDQALGFLCVFVFVEITIAMSAPSLAKRIATARPIPLSPPVARATLFWSFPLAPDCASSDFGCGVISYRRPGC